MCKTNASPGRIYSGSQKKRNRKHSSIRARVEYVFRVIKQQFVFTRTRYRGLMKNAVQVNIDGLGQPVPAAQEIVGYLRGSPLKLSSKNELSAIRVQKTDSNTRKIWKPLIVQRFPKTIRYFPVYLSKRYFFRLFFGFSQDNRNSIINLPKNFRMSLKTQSSKQDKAGIKNIGATYN